MKRFLTVCAALALMMAMALPASASAGSDRLTLAMALNEEGAIAAAPAVIFNDGGVCTVITDTSVYVDGASAYGVILGDGAAPMEFQDLDETSGLAAFTLDAAYLSQPEVLDIAQSIQVGEELTYCFLYVEEDGTTVQKGSARVLEREFNVTLPDGVNEARIAYPAIALTRAGELAVIDGRQSAVPLCSVGEGGSAPTSTQTPDDPNPTNTPKGRPDPTPAPTPGPGPGPGPGLSTETIVAIVIAVILVAGGITIFLKKRNSGGSTPPVQPIAPTEPMEPVRPAQPVPDSPERIEPVQIKPKSSALYLCCEGGVMDGRRYPVGTTTILIGRDPSCSIRYPADTKGVSRRHCEIFWKNGVLNIMDLGSTSGTFIRGKGQIAANAPVAVNAGDTFYLGEKRNAFVIRMGE